MNNQHSGTLRTDQEANLARLDDFQVLTSDLRIQLHRLEKSGGTLRPLLENHVLTVLADISRKQLSGYGESFADAQGTADVARYAEKLRRDVEDWSRRLEAYILQGLMSGRSGSVAIEIAQKLDDSLKAILPDGSVAKKEDYYRMLRTVTAIQKQADRYTKQAEESGDTEPALALLLAYLKTTVASPILSTIVLPRCPASIFGKSCMPSRKPPSRTMPTQSSPPRKKQKASPWRQARHSLPEPNRFIRRSKKSISARCSAWGRMQSIRTRDCCTNILCCKERNSRSPMAKHYISAGKSSLLC